MDIDMLMAGQVSFTFKDLTITLVKTAYLGFQEKLTGLPSKGLLKCTLGESVQISHIGSSTFACVTLIAYQLIDFACFTLSFQGAYQVPVIFLQMWA